MLWLNKAMLNLLIKNLLAKNFIEDNNYKCYNLNKNLLGVIKNKKI